MSTVPSCTSSQIQCQRTAICFVRLWNLGFFAIAIDRSLSPLMTVGISSFSHPNSVYRFLNQHASCEALDKATYSACTDDNAVEICFLELQVIVPSPVINT